VSWVRERFGTDAERDHGTVGAVATDGQRTTPRRCKPAERPAGTGTDRFGTVFNRESPLTADTMSRRAPNG
jgi:hypothetical protein